MSKYFIISSARAEIVQILIHLLDRDKCRFLKKNESHSKFIC